MSISISLDGKVALVTGASRGIGKAIAETLVAAGAYVFGTATSASGADAISDYLGDKGQGLVLNVTDSASVEAVFAAIKAARGDVDILVNNAGITQPVKFLDITGADYDRILDVSLRGTLYMSQAVLPAMRSQQGGSIICISSVSAQRGGGILGGPHYSAAKAGVLGLARAMAREFGPENIRINCITPGLIGTDIIKGKLTEEKKAEIAETIPLARLGRAEDIAGACVFLASPLSTYCTGITLDVNGGMLIH